MASSLGMIEALSYVPPRVARHYGVVPLQREASGLVFAARDPSDWRLKSILARHARGPFRIIQLDPDVLDYALGTWYGASGALHEFLEICNDPGRPSGLDSKDHTVAPAVRFVELLLEAALSERASDVHFVPDPERPTLRFRVDGLLAERPAPQPDLARRALSRIKALCGLDLGTCTYAQDGQFRHLWRGETVDVRVSILPTDRGEVAVLRLLTEKIVQRSLHDLGLPEAVQRRMKTIAAAPHGLTIVAGPTGAGKTTTMHAVLRLVDAKRRNLISIEDPIEIRSPGMRQVPVRSRAGLDFANVLRAVVRQDPDVIFVGETRDAETARLVLQASLAGHLVFTTVHANDCPTIFERFDELGASRRTLAETTLAVVSQRLVRLRCPMCAGTGCFPCEGSGLRGRQAIFECLPVKGEVAELVARGAPAAVVLACARKAGFRSLRDHAAELVDAGRTTAAEVVRVLGEDVP